eukprot:13931232-Alexandrium_andersonii.AAC.1
MGEAATVSGRAWLEAQSGGTLVSQAAPLAWAGAALLETPSTPLSPPLARGAVVPAEGGQSASSSFDAIPT